MKAPLQQLKHLCRTIAQHPSVLRRCSGSGASLVRMFQPTRDWGTFYDRMWSAAWNVSPDFVEIAPKSASFREATSTVERIIFRTGEFRLRDFTRRRHTEPFLTSRLPNADLPEPGRQFTLDYVTVVTGSGGQQGYATWSTF